MTGRAPWWLAAACALSACALSACAAALGYHATWPGCSTSRGSSTMTVVEPGQTNSNVTGIHLINCNFTTVNWDTLKTYPNVKDINLKNVKADNVRARICDSFNNLELLTMKNTAILGKNLPSDFFRDCHRLHYIDIKDSDMSHTPTDLLQGMSQLRTLFVNNCALREVPSFFTSQVLPNMDFFQANHNVGISKLNSPETFANAVNLTWLVLANNSIDYIHPNALEPLTKIKRIRLGSNKLRNIPEPLFQHKAYLNYLDLSYNLIENIPFNAFLGTDLKYLRLNDNKLTHLPGNFLSNLQSTGVNLMEFHFFGNFWECGCLNKLLVNIKMKKNDYDTSRYDGRHQACRLVPSILIDHNNCT